MVHPSMNNEENAGRTDTTIPCVFHEIKTRELRDRRNPFLQALCDAINTVVMLPSPALPVYMIRVRDIHKYFLGGITYDYMYTPTCNNLDMFLQTTNFVRRNAPASFFRGVSFILDSRLTIDIFVRSTNAASTGPFRDLSSHLAVKIYCAYSRDEEDRYAL